MGEITLGKKQLEELAQKSDGGCREALHDRQLLTGPTIPRIQT